MTLRRRVGRLCVPLVAVLGAVVLTSCVAPAPPQVGAGTIMGPSELTADQIVAYVRSVQATYGRVWRASVDEHTLAQLFIDEGAAENVRGDIAFCQSIHETGWFEFGGYSQPQDNNFGGIGAFAGSDRYMTQPTAQLGVRAQIQHLRNYADATSRAANLANPLVLRPRYDAAAYDSFVYKGAAPTWIDLNGTWAVPGSTYGQNILRICSDIRASAGLPRLTSADIGATSDPATDGPVQATNRS